MSGSADIEARLAQANGLPHHQRVRPLEQLVIEADAAGDEPVAARVRFALMSALDNGDSPSAHMFAPFAWLVQRFDSAEWWRGEHDRELLWQYKWVITAASRDHAVPLATVESLIEGMQERYRRRSASEAPILMLRHVVQARVNGHRAAEDTLRAWLSAPRGRYSDCEACEPSHQALHLASVGRDADTVDLFRRVHDGALDCTAQPQLMYSVSVPSLLRTGAEDLAVAAHVLGTRLTRDRPGQALLDARQLRACALAGQVHRAYDLYARRASTFSRPKDPASALEQAAAVAVALERLIAAEGDVEVVAPDGAPRSAASLAEEMRETAERHAVAFDARNGTDTCSRQLADDLAAPDLPPLDLRVLDAAARTQRRPAPGPQNDRSRPLAGSGWSSGADQSLAENQPAPRNDVAATATPRQEVADADVTTLASIGRAAVLADDSDELERVVARWLGTQEAAAASEQTAGWSDEEVDAAAWLHFRAGLAMGPDSRAEARSSITRSMALLETRGWHANAALCAAALLHLQQPPDAPADHVGIAAGPDRLADDLVALVERLDSLAGSSGARFTATWQAWSLRAALRRIACQLTSRDDDRRRWRAEALDLLADVDASSPPHDRVLRAGVLLMVEDREDLDARMHEVLGLLHDGTRPVDRATALAWLTAAAVERQEPGIALDRLEAAVLVARHSRPAFPVVAGLVHRHAGAFARPEYADRAQAILEQLLRGALDDGDVVESSAIRLDLWRILRSSGRGLEAAELVELAAAELGAPGAPTTHSSLSVPWLRAMVSDSAADSALSLGESRRAARLAQQAGDQWTAEGEPEHAFHSYVLEARALEHEGQTVAALTALRRCAQRGEALVADTFGVLSATTWAMRRSVGTAAVVDGTNAAVAAARDAERFISTTVAAVDTLADDDSRLRGGRRSDVTAFLRGERAALLLAQARVLLDVDPPGARRLLHELPSEAASIGAWARAVEAHELLGSALARCGEEAEAVDSWRRGAELATSQGLADSRIQVASTWAGWLDDNGSTQEGDAVWARWGPVDPES